MSPFRARARGVTDMQSDGTVMLHPATLMTAAQARLLARPDIMEAVDKLAADPSAGVRRGRPRRSQA